MAISGFNGPNRFLSNFYPSEVEFEGLEYPTVEHAYQAAKTLDPTLRQMIQHCYTPAAAKSAGRGLVLRDDWEDVKIPIMKRLLEKKFYHPELEHKLLGTAPFELVEANYWHDIYWGRCQCEKHAGRGENNLGRLLMELRDELS